MKVKEENEKVGLKLNIQKAKIMTSGPITSWEVRTQETHSRLNPPQKEQMPPSFQLGLLEEEFHPVRPTGCLSEGLALPTNDLILRRTAAPPM